MQQNPVSRGEMIKYRSGDQPLEVVGKFKIFQEEKTEALERL